ncbi:hypothetical protein [Muriicola marianensis]|uniref:SH3 domain-containing protein n=1 Tax=Muriicola marianensis TaxID=1324801 RepID=A0ABQ1R0Y7_9FLAO|nr:hypothetical protein [Muriicola marianensis]GGD54135.1 hypothetical protein GCM10011361_21030 [Muriicola marianensis]
MSETKKSKSAWEITQSIILLLTPVLVAVMGYFFNRSLTQIESQIANVSAMQPFMEMIADKDITTSKMGAYAIYMLKKDDDPQIAAQMILAPGKPHLMDVLVDIGTRDTAIKNVVNRVLENIDLNPGDSVQLSHLSDIQRNALQIIDKIDEQTANATEFATTNEEQKIAAVDWLYLGNFTPGLTSDRIIAGTPKEGETYDLIKGANVRADKPRKENNYRLPQFVRVAKKGSKIKIDTLTTDKKNHKWARVYFVQE